MKSYKINAKTYLKSWYKQNEGSEVSGYHGGYLLCEVSHILVQSKAQISMNRYLAADSCTTRFHIGLAL